MSRHVLLSHLHSSHISDNGSAAPRCILNPQGRVHVPSDVQARHQVLPPSPVPVPRLSVTVPSGGSRMVPSPPRPRLWHVLAYSCLQAVNGANISLLPPDPFSNFPSQAAEGLGKSANLIVLLCAGVALLRGPCSSSARREGCRVPPCHLLTLCSGNTRPPAAPGRLVGLPLRPSVPSDGHSPPETLPPQDQKSCFSVLNPIQSSPLV